MIPSRTTLLFGAALLLALACAVPDSTSPSSQTSATGAAVFANPASSGMSAARGERGHEFPSPARCEPAEAVVASGTFGPDGGVLRIGDSYLAIPAGALASRVTITGRSLGDRSSTIEFQPEGLRFRKPAGLVFSSEGCRIPPGVTPSVVYLGATGEVLEDIPASYDHRRRRVAAPIHHFSGYAIAF